MYELFKSPPFGRKLKPLITESEYQNLDFTARAHYRRKYESPYSGYNRRTEDNSPAFANDYSGLGLYDIPSSQDDSPSFGGYEGGSGGGSGAGGSWSDDSSSSSYDSGSSDSGSSDCGGSD